MCPIFLPGIKFKVVSNKAANSKEIPKNIFKWSTVNCRTPTNDIMATIFGN